MVLVMETYLIIHLKELTSSIGMDKLRFDKRGDAPEPHKIVNRIFENGRLNLQVFNDFSRVYGNGCRRIV